MVKKNIISTTGRLRAVLGSKLWWRFALAFFTFETLWIVFSGRYPMAFDEATHLNIIQFFSHQWLPFFSGQPSSMDAFGAVARDPSYMYHYLLSFPYRIFAHFVSSQSAQVIFLRLINVIIFGYAIAIFRKVLQFSGNLSKPIVNGILSLFILVPVVPLVAGQVNYDSLVLLITAWALLLTLQVKRSFSEGKFNPRLLSELFVMCTVGSLTKYAFLPIFLALAMYVAIAFWRQPNKKSFAKEFNILSRLAKISIVVGVLVSSGLFFERYGLNTIHYGTPIPECNQVLGVERCRVDQTWYRNYVYAQTKEPLGLVASANLYKGVWVHGMLTTLTYAEGPLGTHWAGSLPLPKLAEYLALVAFVLLFVRYGDKLYSADEAMPLFIVVAAVYVGVLFAQNFGDFLHLGKGLGIQGRYLLPVLPLIIAMCASMINIALPKRSHVKMIVFAVLLLFMLEGGGFMTFIMRSGPTWYWDNPMVITVNRKIQSILSRVVI